MDAKRDSDGSAAARLAQRLSARCGDDAWIGAIRLARPQSTWAKRHYSPSKLERATRRADGFDARWGRYGLALGDLVAGRPTEVTAGPANE